MIITTHMLQAIYKLDRTTHERIIRSNQKNFNRKYQNSFEYFVNIISVCVVFCYVHENDLFRLVWFNGCMTWSFSLFFFYYYFFFLLCIWICRPDIKMKFNSWIIDIGLVYPKKKNKIMTIAQHTHTSN